MTKTLSIFLDLHDEGDIEITPKSLVRELRTLLDKQATTTLNPPTKPKAPIPALNLDNMML